MLALLIILCVCVYVADIFLILGYEWARYAFYIAAAIALLLDLIIIITSAAKKPIKNRAAAMTCMILKCALIPHYMLNVTIGAAMLVMSAATLLWLPISLVIGLVLLIVIGFNYFTMLATGMPLVCSIVKNRRMGSFVSSAYIATQFFFVADIIGAVLLTVTGDERRTPPPPPYPTYGWR